jgi:ParB/RepB/Spo0J family partition protein
MVREKSDDDESVGPTAAPIRNELVVQIPLSKIFVDFKNPRKKNEKIQELTESLESEEDVLIYPIIVEELGNDTYDLLDGHRRFEAAQKAGLSTIKAIIQPRTDTITRLMQRARLNNQQIAYSDYDNIVHLGQLWTLYKEKHPNRQVKDMARSIGMHSETLRFILHVYESPQAMQALRNGIKFDAAIAIARQRDPTSSQKLRERLEQLQQQKREMYGAGSRQSVINAHEIETIRFDHTQERISEENPTLASSKAASTIVNYLTKQAMFDSAVIMSLKYLRSERDIMRVVRELEERIGAIKEIETNLANKFPQIVTKATTSNNNSSSSR